MTIYVGIDDTDNLQSRGTGHLVRTLAEELRAAGLGTPLSVTRHQLLVHPDIPYTSHNSSACVTMRSEAGPEAVAAAAGRFLRERAASGSDPGLCVAEAGKVAEAVVRFGQSAKARVLTTDEAHRTAGEAGLHLSGHGGTNGGVIGALAAVGLRHSGGDGRFLWLRGIREMTGVHTTAEILAQSGVERFLNVGEDGKPALVTPSMSASGSVRSSSTVWRPC